GFSPLELLKLRVRPRLVRRLLLLLQSSSILQTNPSLINLPQTFISMTTSPVRFLLPIPHVHPLYVTSMRLPVMRILHLRRFPHPLYHLQPPNPSLLPLPRIPPLPLPYHTLGMRLLPSPHTLPRRRQSFQFTHFSSVPSLRHLRTLP